MEYWSVERIIFSEYSFFYITPVLQHAIAPLRTQELLYCYHSRIFLIVSPAYANAASGSPHSMPQHPVHSVPGAVVADVTRTSARC